MVNPRTDLHDASTMSSIGKILHSWNLDLLSCDYWYFVQI